MNESTSRKSLGFSEPQFPDLKGVCVCVCVSVCVCPSVSRSEGCVWGGVCLYLFVCGRVRLSDCSAVYDSNREVLQTFA